MASLADWIKSQTADYGQLKEAYPNAIKFGSALKKGISQLIPSNEDFKSPEAMRDWSTAAALNAPMGLTFIGKNAANWNPVKAAEAEKLLNAGVDPAQVWKDHLIGRMPDKSLFSEIDDNVAKLNPLIENGNVHKWTMGQFGINAGETLAHKKLYKNYPVLEKIPTQGHVLNELDYFLNSLEGKGTNQTGSYSENGISFKAPASEAKSILIHELQHAIQQKEGWARGGSPDNPPLLFMDEINKIREEKSKLNFDPYAISNKITSGYYVP